MALFVELRDGHPTLNQSSNTPGAVGPVLGPFLGARLLRDELRVVTAKGEFNLPRIAPDWVIYDGTYFSDIEIITGDEIGPARKRRRQTFDPRKAEMPWALGEC
jgi:hypothetical protein